MGAGTHLVNSSKEFRAIRRVQFVGLLDAGREEIFVIPFHDVIAFRQMARSAVFSAVAVALVAPGISVRAQEAQLKTADAVLERYKRALGGSEAVQKVQSMTVHGEVESSARPGKSTFIYYARPFKSRFELTRPDGTEITAGFDGKTSWTITPQGASIDKDTAVDAIRRDTDLQYALHQPDYFRKLELAGRG
jgi:hypothetical protein